MRTLEEALAAGPANNLNLIRLAAASAVLISHSYPLTGGPNAHDPLERLIGIDLGGLAVAVFFVVSGLLITRSFQHHRALKEWFLGRALRLFPALVIVLVLCALILGPIVSERSVGDYFAQSRTWRYVPSNLTLAMLQYDLPGVFKSNPYPDAVNGSLWTLFFEVGCYGVVLALGIARLLCGRKAPWGVAVVIAVAIGLVAAASWFAPRHAVIVSQAGFLLMPFALGMLASVLADRVCLSACYPAAALVLAASTWALPVFWITRTLAIAVIVLWIGFVPRDKWLRFNRFGDISYGVYVYAFPVQQTAVWLWPGQLWWQNCLSSALPVLGFATLSWLLVEKPAIAYGRRLARLASIADTFPAAPAK